MAGEAFEFEVTVTVRKRIWVSGPQDRETARSLLQSAISGGLGFGPFAKKGQDGHPIETVISNTLVVEDIPGWRV